MDTEPLAASLDAALSNLERAPQPGKPLREAVLDAATGLADSPAGIGALAAQAHRFESAGLFVGGPWEHADRLLPHLVAGGLRGAARTPVIEICSELRVLAIAVGRVHHPEVTVEQARSFLRSVVVNNLDLLGPGATEDVRARPEVFARAGHLVAHLVEHLSPSAVLEALVDEIDQLACQRPIRTGRARALIARAALLEPPAEHSAWVDLLATYRHAVEGPSPLSQRCPDVADYRAALPGLDERDLDVEIRSLAHSLRVTGLAAPHHAVLLRHLAEVAPDEIGPALGLDPTGMASLSKFLPFVQELIEVAVHPELAEGILGLAGTLERGLLSRRAVSGGLRRLFDVPLHPTPQRHLLAHIIGNSGLTAHAALVSGALSVLGQPIGVGQGNNPTCQSARGISLWSVHAPGYLLNLLIAAARDDSLTFEFEGQALVSSTLTGGVATRIDRDLDPVSIVLVPHLDRLYDEMMRRALLRGEDPHKWVNPAFYGRWVPTGFACAINALTKTVTSYEAFVRQLFATHHPACNDGDDLIYPNPVGLFVTDVHGRMLGAHAVSLRRVDVDGSGRLRAYFFNPNNEGRQDWGFDVVTSVRGNGEIPGESSLPFEQFASRLYAFHFHPYEGGSPAGVPDRAVSEVVDAARISWGRSYAWEETAPP